MAIAKVTAAPSDTWLSGTSGLWSAGANWSFERPPRPGESVIISSTTPLTVTDDGAGLSLGSLMLVDDELALVGGPLAVSGAALLQNAEIAGPQIFYSRGTTTVAGATLAGGGTWINTGSVTQAGGTVTLGDSTAALAVIDNLAGATWTISDASGLAAGTGAASHFVNYGLFQKTSSGSVAVENVNFFSTGTIAVAGGGDIEFNGPSTVLSGTFVGSGMVDAGPDDVATYEDIDVTQSSCQTEYGVVDLVGTMTMYDGSTITTETGSHWNFDGDSSLVLAQGQSAGPIIHGTGEIAKTAGTGTSVVSIEVDTDDTVNVATGTLAFEGATSQFAGAITGAGVFEIDGGEAAVGPGAPVSVANWRLAGGDTTLGENLSYAGDFTGDAGATLTLGGFALTLSGTSQLQGLTLAGAGVLRSTGAATDSGLTIGGTTEYLVDAAVTQSGGDDTLGDASATDAAKLVIGPSGVWRLADAHSILLGADPNSSIVIAGSSTAPGLLDKSGAGVSIVQPDIVNGASNLTSVLGGIEAAAGTLDIQGTVGGIGSDNIVGAATLEFDNVVGSFQSVFFSGANGVLDLTDLAGYHAKINGFDTVGSDDALLIGGGWVYAGASATTSAATLAFALNGAHVSITLNGDYVEGSFSALPDGANVTKVTFGV